MRYHLFLPLLPLLLPLTHANPANPPAPVTYELGGYSVGDSSTLTITAYSDAKCSHGAKTWVGKYYGIQSSYPSGFRSYKLSRDLLDSEQLDFSTSADSMAAGSQGVNDDKIMDAGMAPDSCGVFTKKATAREDRGGGVCHGVVRSSACVNLWKNAP